MVQSSTLIFIMINGSKVDLVSTLGKKKLG